MRVHSLDGRVFEFDPETLAPFRISDEEVERLVGADPAPLPDPLPPGSMPPPPKPPPSLEQAMAAEQQAGRPPPADAQAPLVVHHDGWVQVQHLPGQIVITINPPPGGPPPDKSAPPPGTPEAAK